MSGFVTEKLEDLKTNVHLLQDKAGLERLAERQDIQHDVLTVFQQLKNGIEDAVALDDDLTAEQKQYFAEAIPELKGLDVKHLMSLAQIRQADTIVSLDDLDVGTFNADLFQELIDLFANVPGSDLTEEDIVLLQIAKTFLRFADLSGASGRVALLTERRLEDARMAFEASNVYDNGMRMILSSYTSDNGTLDLDNVATEVFETVVHPYLVAHPGLLNDPLTADTLALVFGPDRAADLIADNFEGSSLVGRFVGPTIQQAMEDQMIMFLHNVHQMSANKTAARKASNVFNTTPTEVLLYQAAQPLVEAFTAGMSGTDPVLLTQAVGEPSFVPVEISEPRINPPPRTKNAPVGDFKNKRPGSNGFENDKSMKRRKGLDRPSFDQVDAGPNTVRVSAEARDFNKPPETFALMLRAASERFGAIMDRALEIFQVPTPKGFSSVEALTEIIAVAGDIVQLEQLFSEEIGTKIGFGFGLVSSAIQTVTSGSALGQLLSTAQDKVTNAVSSVFEATSAVGSAASSVVSTAASAIRTFGKYAPGDLSMAGIGLALQLFTGAPFLTLGVPAFKAAKSFANILNANSFSEGAGLFTTGIISLSGFVSALPGTNVGGAFAQMLVDRGVSDMAGLITHFNQLAMSSMIAVDSFRDILTSLATLDGRRILGTVAFQGINLMFAVLNIQRVSMMPRSGIRTIFEGAKSSITDSAAPSPPTVALAPWKRGILALGTAFKDVVSYAGEQAVNLVADGASIGLQQAVSEIKDLAVRAGYLDQESKFFDELIPNILNAARSPEAQRAWIAFSAAYSHMYADAAGRRTRLLFQGDLSTRSNLRRLVSVAGITLAGYYALQSVSSWQQVLQEGDVSQEDMDAYIRSMGGDLTEIQAATDPAAARAAFLESVADPQLTAAYGLDRDDTPMASARAFVNTTGLISRAYRSLAALASFDFQSQTGVQAATFASLLATDALQSFLDPGPVEPVPDVPAPEPEDPRVVNIVDVIEAAALINRLIRPTPVTSEDALAGNLINPQMDQGSVGSSSATRRAMERQRNDDGLTETYSQVLQRIAGDETRVQTGITENDPRRTLNSLWLATTFAQHLAARDMLSGFPAQPSVAGSQAVADQQYQNLLDRGEISPELERTRELIRQALDSISQNRVETIDVSGRQEAQEQTGVVGPWVLDDTTPDFFMSNRDDPNQVSNLDGVLALDSVLQDFADSLVSGEGSSNF